MTRTSTEDVVTTTPPDHENQRQDGGAGPNGRWFVSPWNNQPEATDGLSFPSKVIFHDTTLRDGEQQAGIALRSEDKIAIAKKLAEAGVDRIEAGMPVVSSDDEAALKAIVQMDLGPEIYAFARCMVEDVKKAKECEVSGIVVEIPSSTHLVEHGYGWKFETAIKLSIEATLAAKDAGLRTVFFTIDSSRADMEWYLDLIERVATEGHMDALTLVDTFGGVSMHAIPFWVRKVRERLPDVQLEAHVHNDFGLAVANSIAALRGGMRSRAHDRRRNRRAGRELPYGGVGARSPDVVLGGAQLGYHYLLFPSSAG